MKSFCPLAHFSLSRLVFSPDCIYVSPRRYVRVCHRGSKEATYRGGIRLSVNGRCGRSWCILAHRNLNNPILKTMRRTYFPVWTGQKRKRFDFVQAEIQRISIFQFSEFPKILFFYISLFWKTFSQLFSDHHQEAQILGEFNFYRDILR